MSGAALDRSTQGHGVEGRVKQSRGRIGLIWAEAEDGVIGKDGVMPWHIPEDLAHFKRITLGAPVVMGRKTWDSLPVRFRPLAGRRNIVVTRQQQWSVEGVDAVHSVGEALELAAGESANAAADDDLTDEPGVALAGDSVGGASGDSAGDSSRSSAGGDFIWVLGGAEIFRSVLDQADRLEVTQIRARFEGDTVAPTIDSRWKLVAEDPAAALPAERTEASGSVGIRWHTSCSGLEYRFLRYELC